MRTGERKEFELLKSRYDDSSTPDKARIVSALGCANDTDILAVYLLDSTDPTATINGRQVFTAVCQNPLGVNLALDFFWGGTTEVGKAFSEDLAPKLNTPDQLKQLQQLLLLGGSEFRDIEGGVELAIGTLEDTLFWQENHRTDVFVAMGGKRNPNPGSGTASSISVSVFLLFLNFILYIGH
ncbi:hypothetical protein B566_EDAN002877 [Ephemera danica]|nr:hypothetical protein B566_EDAN002877 [Ephemera danica]